MDNSIRLLDVWTCPECATEQWAVVEVAGTRIDRIEGVLLNRATLEGANFIVTVAPSGSEARCWLAITPS